MRILGIGIDLIEVERIESAVERFGVRFLERVYTKNELEVANRRKNNYQYLALRFAVKEAVMKALGYGWSGGIKWRDIECLNEGSSPKVNLYGRAKEIADEMNYTTVLTTTSHTDNHAICSVTLVS